jgi:hypothetical protein
MFCCYCGFWPLVILFPFAFLALGRKAVMIAAVASISVVIAFVLSVYVPGWLLMPKAHSGDPHAQYELARWTENHCYQINEYLFWPCDLSGDNTLDGYAWLERAAVQDYPPAVWLVGVRLKYGIHVPRPANWTGASGNVFPQPERGQEMIDHAIQLGFQPPADEENYYDRAYRK